MFASTFVISINMKNLNARRLAKESSDADINALKSVIKTVESA